MCEILDRSAQGVEWAIFSALWSEHCSYKSSARYLKMFHTSKKNVNVLESMGENAGVIDIGQGERVAFKMESHNHPSFISPYEGSSTGVGGILRDIFTMGAFPIALSNYLCFGEIEESSFMKSLVEGVVRGIGDYGNCVGVPMLTGQTEFEGAYNQNILVNAMALGLFKKDDKVSLSKAQGVGNWVVYVGAKTGRDGIHGASMASQSFEGEKEAQEQKTTVQIGDPFLGKLLIESCYEVIQKGLVVAIQDMGAAGLTSSSFEMAKKGAVGLNLYLDKVPLRESSLGPEEILLSESQERMLLVCEKESFKEIETVFSKWDLDVAVIGEVIEEKKIHLFWHKEKLTSLKPEDIVDKAPEVRRPYEEWTSRSRVKDFKKQKGFDFKKELLFLLRSQASCSRAWIYRQYDKRVGGRTALECSDTIGAVYLERNRFLGLALGCRPYLMQGDAFEGAKDAFFFPALSLSVKGFKPLAVTDCLNFGSPEKKEVMGEFVASVKALAESSHELDIPVVSGNVSFYNETEGKNIIPTPVIGMVGLKQKAKDIKGSFFTKDQSYIFLTKIPLNFCTTGLAHYLKTKTMEIKGEGLNLKKEFLGVLEKVASREEVLSSRLVGKGGLAYQLLLMSFQKEIGFKLFLEDLSFSPEEFFYENFYDILWEVRSSEFKVEGLKTYQIGTTQKEKTADFGQLGSFDLLGLKKQYKRQFLK